MTFISKYWPILLIALGAVLSMIGGFANLKMSSDDSEKAINLGRENKDLNERNSQLNERNFALSQQILDLGKTNNDLGRTNNELGQKNNELSEKNIALTNQMRRMIEEQAKENSPSGEIK